MKVTIIVIGALVTVTKGLVQGLEGKKITGGNWPNDRIADIG